MSGLLNDFIEYIGRPVQVWLMNDTSPYWGIVKGVRQDRVCLQRIGANGEDWGHLFFLESRVVSFCTGYPDLIRAGLEFNTSSVEESCTN